MGTAPEGNIENPEDLLPTEKLLLDLENLGTTTELLTLKPMKLSSDLMNYLRSVLMNNFDQDEDFKQVLVSSPRVVRYEIIVIDFALKLLDTYAKKILFSKSTLAQD